MTPKLGDTIETTLQTWKYYSNIPKKLRCVLTTQASVEYARLLITQGKWKIVK